MIDIHLGCPTNLIYQYHVTWIEIVLKLYHTIQVTDIYPSAKFHQYLKWGQTYRCIYVWMDG